MSQRLRLEGEYNPFLLLTALQRNEVSYVVIGGFARVLHGTGELSDGLDITPSLHPTNVNRLLRALDEVNATRPDGKALTPESFEQEPFLPLDTKNGGLKVVSLPQGTRGYDDLRRHASREYLGPGWRIQVASPGDLARMLGSLEREQDLPTLLRLRRTMEIERDLSRGRDRGLGIER